MRSGLLLGLGAIMVGSLATGGVPVEPSGAKRAAVPLKLSGGHPSIELRINGKGPFRLLFDTGSGAELILDQDLADELGLKTTGMRRIGDPNSPEALEARVVRVDRIELGGLSWADVGAIAWKPQVTGMSGLPRGVVGLGLFGARLVTLDDARGELVVETGNLPEPDGKTILAASFEDGIPSLPISVAGVAFRAHLDSGSTGFLGLPLDAAKKLPLDAPPVEVGRARTASGDYAVSEARLAGPVHLGGIVIDNPKLRFVNLPIGNLGFDLLRSLIVTIDRKNARVRLVKSGKPLEPSERPRLGIMIRGPKDGRLPIDSVVPGSIAAKAGLRAGDQIVRLNGQEAAAMGAFALSQALQARPLTIALVRDGESVELTVPAGP